MQGMEITELDIEELRGKPFQRRAFPRPDLSVVTVHIDDKGDIRLTLHTKGSTLIPEATDGERSGP